MKQILETIRENHIAAVEGMFRDCSEQIAALAARCAEAFEANHKLLFCGNGGSACDAMHIAGEFVGRFVDDRRSLPALALTPDSGIITAVANDYSYEQIFSRQVEGLGQKGDVLIALSTSGSSPNVLKALAVGKAKGLTTALLTGEKARGKAIDADFVIVVPSLITAHVQEAHMIALHGLASLIEAKLFPRN